MEKIEVREWYTENKMLFHIVSLDKSIFRKNPVLI